MVSVEIQVAKQLCRISEDIWAICPTAHAALFKMIKSAAIIITLITNRSCQSHERYQQHLDDIRKHRMSLMLELPAADDKGADRQDDD